METKKIAIAIFVGIFVGAMVTLALTAAPLLRWLLGVLVGSSVGLLLYDLKEVQEKAPLAWRKTVKRGTVALKWFKKPHPFLWLSLLVFAPFALFGLKLALGSKDIMLLFLLPLALGGYFTFVFCLILLLLTKIGSSKHRFGKNCCWGKDKFGVKQGSGDVYIEFSYRNIYGLMLRGLWICIYFVFWEMWILAPTFLWHLFKLISSHERILCAIYCTAGITVIHILFGHQASLLGQKIIIAVSGGIIGAAVGVIHYWLVQLFLTPATNKI